MDLEDRIGVIGMKANSIPRRLSNEVVEGEARDNKDEVVRRHDASGIPDHDA